MPNLGIGSESHKDSDDDSTQKEMDWGLIFMMLKQRGFAHNEILDLSYPQFNAYMKHINNPLSYSVTIPYMGGGTDEEEKEGSKVQTPEEILSIVSQMNQDFI